MPIKDKMPPEGIPDVPSFFLDEHQEYGGYESEGNGKIKGCKYADLIPEQPGNQGGREGAKTDGHLKDTQACGPITLRRELRDECRLDRVQNAFM